ncbi:17037_t:CDS:2 [Funneliformis geosporum]|nr:17037_t:CDS:2 [Funneliformis geosporum]
MEHGEKDDDTDLPADLPPDQKDLIYREIAFFRERAAARERERQREEEERASRRAKAEKEREQRRWQHREETMATNREREAERDLDIREKQIRDREIMARKLAEWDDDVEAERGQEEYYRDRSRWWFHRQQFRARELALDESDRLREQQDIDAEQRRIEWERMLEEERKQREEAIVMELNAEKEISTNSTNGTSQHNNVKAKLTLNLASKRRAALMAPAEEEEFDDEEDLVENIPTDKEGLWNWNVKWEELDENILNKKLQPFVSKKIVGYLGVQEDELVFFVMDHLRNKKSAANLTKEMEMTLDEESELFVMKLWRMLIFETESKARKI